MEIQNNKLTGVKFKQAADHGEAMEPEAIVVHYTAGGKYEGSVDWLTRRDGSGLSAHIVIGRDGEIVQLVPFDTVAFHAGRSEFGGRTGFNQFSIGIELANWGPLVFNHGLHYSWAGTVVAKENVVAAEHQNAEQYPWLKRHQYWERFYTAQIEALANVIDLLQKEYGIDLIVSHDQIAPDRKMDVGPLLDLGQVKHIIEAKAKAEVAPVAEVAEGVLPEPRKPRKPRKPREPREPKQPREPRKPRKPKDPKQPRKPKTAKGKPNQEED